MTVRVVKGNRKLGAHIPNVNLLPVVTCVPGVPCSLGGNNAPCYCMKSLRMYPRVKESWTHNTKMAEDPEKFFADLEEEWRWVAPTYFRFFSAGDVPSIEFLRAMIAFIRRHPETRFLVFSKRYSWWNRYQSLPENLSLVYSAWPNWPMSNPKNRPVAWMRDPNNVDERIPSDVIECPGLCEDCLACWGLVKAGHSVVFDKH